MAARAAPARRTRGRRGCTRVLVRRRPPSGGRLRAPAREPLQGTAPEPRLGLNGGAAAAEAPRAPRRAGRVRADWAHDWSAVSGTTAGHRRAARTGGLPFDHLGPLERRPDRPADDAMPLNASARGAALQVCP